jgi:GTP-binding protein EngB required for normal cell division
MSEVSRTTAQLRTAPELNQAGRTTVLATALGHAIPALEFGLGHESPLPARLQVLRRRLEHEHLQIAVLGQFKRGKSTFINALLGAPVLPAGVIPLTAVPTFIAWRVEPLVLVRFKDGTPSKEFAVHEPDDIRNVLFRFVAEEANPENRLGVEHVDLFYPADILADRTVIIDTPGVGSTLRHNTEAALQVLPECDAAFFVVSADPPITEVELEYLRRLKSKTVRIFFILNKADYLRPDEQRTVVEFLQKVLSEQSLLDADERIFCVSARDGLEAKQTDNGRALESSGIATLEDHLVRELATRKIRWLEDAVRTKALDVLSQASAELDLRVRALNMPIEELAAKSRAFQEALHSIEEQRRVTRDLLAGDHRRLRDALDSRIHELRKEASTKLVRVIDASLKDLAPTAWEGATQHALSVAIEDEFEAAREPLVNVFATDAGAVLLDCQNRIEVLAEDVRRTAAEIFDVALGSNLEQESFELGEDPYWVTEGTYPSLILNPSRLFDRLLPAWLRRARLSARMIRQADELVVRNAENLRWAILRGLDETFRRATARLEERLDETIRITRDVIRDALDRRNDQSFAVQPELDRLAGTTASLAALREELQGDQFAGPDLSPNFHPAMSRVPG